MTTNGYTFQRDEFPALLKMQRYPEQTQAQTEVMRAYFENHLDEFETVIFEYRLGEGLTPDPTHLPSVQQQTVFQTQQRIDILARLGSRLTIIESKSRVTPSSLGQILSYRLLVMKEFPDAPEPQLVVVGRTSDVDTIDVLNAHGVTVYLYEAPVTGGNAVLGGV